MFSTEQAATFLTIISGSLASVLNFILLVIIVRVRSKHIGQYSFLLFLYTASAFLYSFSQVLGCPNFFVSSSGYLVIDNAHILPTAISTYNTFFFGNCYILNVIILVVSFVYRYCVVCNQQRLETMHNNGWKIGFFCLFLLFSLMTVLVIEMMPYPQCEDEFGPAFYHKFGLTLSQTGYVCIAMIIKHKPNWGIFYALGPFIVLVVVSGMIITICTVKIVQEIKKNARYSSTMARGQKKIFTLLLLQLALPFVFNNLPVQFILISSFLNFDVNKIAHCVGALLSIAQVVDPILTIYFIRPYRVILMNKTRVSSSFRSSHNNISIAV